MTWLASLRLGNRCANGLKFFKWSMTARGTDEISGMPMKHGALHKDVHGGTRQRIRQRIRQRAHAIPHAISRTAGRSDGVDARLGRSPVVVRLVLVGEI